MKLTLARKIALFFGILILLVSAALSVVAVQLSSNALRDKQSAMMLDYADEAATHFGDFINANLDVLTELAMRTQTQTMDWEIQKASLAGDVERLGYMDIAVVTPDGHSSDVISGITADLSDRKYVQKALGGENATSDVLFSKVTNSLVFIEAVPIRGADGGVIGALLGRRDGAALNSFIKTLGTGERGYAFIMGSDTTIFAHPDEKLVLEQRNVFADIETGGSLGAFGAALQGLGMGNRGMANYTLDGQGRITAVTPIPGTDWVLGVGNYESEFLADIGALRLTLILIAAAVVIVGIFVALYLGNRISKPIRNLRNLANQVALGDVEVDTQTDLKDEVGDLVIAFGEMVGNIKAQAEAAERIAAGDLDLMIRPRSDKDKLAISMIAVVNSLKSLVGEAHMLTGAAVAGQLEVRGDTDKFQGGYREIIDGFNNTLNAIVEPLNMALDFIAKLANGAAFELMENRFQGQYGVLIDNLNSVLTSLLDMLEEVQKVSAAAEEGNLSHRADLSRLKGGYADLVAGCNQTAEIFTEHLSSLSEYMETIGRGEIPRRITETYKGEYETIRNSINACIDGLDGLVEGRDVLARMAVNDFDSRVEGNYQGVFNEIAQSVNLVGESITTFIGVLGHVSEGSLEDLARLKAAGRMSDNDRLIPSVLMMLETIASLVEETGMLSASAVEGKLSTRGEADKFKGEYAKVIAGINETLDAVIEPINEASAVLQEVARGNLQTAMEGAYRGDHAAIKTALNETTGNIRSYVSEISEVLAEISGGNLDLAVTADYKGDFVEIKNSLNNIVSSLSQVMGDIGEAADQVASGSRQVSDGSQALSQGATEQASAIQQLTASIAEVAGQTKENAVKAGQASDLSESARDNAEKGNGHMQEMLRSMADINESSNNISRIIKVIDDIAFQTNILALNAAVEAARAGQHGKGFAVVAEEVRNLAARSAAAARETTELIEGSISKVQAGTTIANDTAGALSEIVSGIEKSAELVRGIAEASNEQASGIAQINKGIEQVSQVVQNNSATAEESAASSEELSSQAELLKQMASRFRINKSAKALPGLGGYLTGAGEAPGSEGHEKKATAGEGSGRREAGRKTAVPSPKILLSSEEFDKY